MTRLVKAELLKLRTTRTARTLLALTAAGTAALVALVLLLAGRPGQPSLGADALRQLAGVPAKPLTLAALVLGILAMAGELRHGTATWTFLATPVRGRVVAAKLAAAAVAGLAMALVAAAAVVAVGLPWLRAKGIEVAVADAGLDPQARHAPWELIEALRRDGGTVVLTTHLLDEANRLADEVVLYTSDVPATIAALLELTSRRGTEPANLMVRRASLEDVFLELTGRALRD